MAKSRDYQSYVTDKKWAATYSDYQKRYSGNPRESDKKIGHLTLAALREMQLSRQPRILDIGCSTGNLLRHLRRLMPGADLYGGDLMVPVIDECRRNPDLAGMSLAVMDVFSLPVNRPFDVITCHAVTYMFDKEQFGLAMHSIAGALVPGGAFVGYELVFPGSREQRIVEKSQGHPDGLQLMLRSEDFVRSCMEAASFTNIEVQPFDIPIDLPKPEPTGTDADLVTYTVRDAVTGRRLMYRGDLFQPWAHITARRA